MLISRRGGGVFVLCALAWGCGGTVTDSQGAMSLSDRDALADSVLRLSREVMAAGEALDVEGMVAWFKDVPGSGFGGASGIMLTLGEFRSNLEAAYGGMAQQEFEATGERVAILGPDAAVVMGLGGFVMTDTIGSRALGNQAFTFVWARANDEWRIVQAHFSSNLMSVEPSGAEPR